MLLYCLIYYNQKGYNIESINILKTAMYERTYKKCILDKHLKKELDRINKIEVFIKLCENMQELITNDLCVIYGIQKKKGNLNEIYTAKVNNKIRLHMKPVGEYPYNMIEIQDIEFIKIDDSHYGEG